MSLFRRSIGMRTYFAAAGLLLVGGIAGFFLRDLLAERPDHHYTVLREPGWEFINPLLDCEEAREVLHNRMLVSIERDVKDFIENRLSRTWTNDIAVYFRELNDGPWFSVGETGNFRPASLLKVPLMIAVLKQADRDPAILKKRVPFTDPEVAALPNPVRKALRFGRTYTVDELVSQMIVHSDNIATYLLANTVDLDILRQTYRDLGLPNPYYRIEGRKIVTAASDYQVSVRAYASFFRILYNASYLSETMSDKALRLLSGTDNRNGIVAGVPPHIKVAHKWGIPLSGERMEIKQFHDCGIVYYPEHPYVLCVMSSGASVEYLDDAVSSVSRVVYEHIDRQHRETPTPLSP